jgi:hypothetical protein
MKKLSFTLLAVIMCMGAFAYHGSSKLRVKAWDNSTFILVMNQHSFPMTNNLRADEVAPGRHEVQIFKRYSTPYGCGTVTREIFCGNIDIPRSSQVRAVFRPNCGLTITSVQPLYTGPVCGHGSHFGQCDHGCQANGQGGHGGHDGHGGQDNISTCGHGHQFGHCGYGCSAPVDNGSGYGTDNGSGYGQGNGGNVNNGSGYGTNNQGGNNQGGNNQNGNGWDDGDYFDNVSNTQYGNGHGGNSGNGSNMGMAMNGQQFQNLKYQIRNATFDSDQLRIARQAIRANGATSKQVRELMQMVSFESTRLELAKSAYRFTADQRNYYIVNDAFSFSSSVRELNSFINRQG